MRFVPVKSAEQLAVQAVHRIRSRLVADRVRLVNQVRGLLGEQPGMASANALASLRWNARKSIEARGDDRSSRVTKPDIRQLL
jgi:transposase